MGDRVLGPYRQGQEVELPLWIATHFVQMGYAKFREEDQLTYFQVRRLIKELKALEAKDRAKGRDLDKALSLSRDIVNIRIKKIASLSASGEQPTELTSNLTAEELALYQSIRSSIDAWKRDILGREAS
ncbi:DNA replication complex GINS family protein [Candidatus Bathyarchaeota archaeon]|nr:MAG: DNA replication complex GINS family protein [Candidatus Bathyarchaeota archaeon]